MQNSCFFGVSGTYKIGIGGYHFEYDKIGGSCISSRHKTCHKRSWKQTQSDTKKDFKGNCTDLLFIPNQIGRGHS